MEINLPPHVSSSDEQSFVAGNQQYINPRYTLTLPHGSIIQSLKTKKNDFRFFTIISNPSENLSIRSTVVFHDEVYISPDDSVSKIQLDDKIEETAARVDYRQMFGEMRSLAKSKE